MGKARRKERNLAKMLKLITVTTDLQQTQPLIRSAQKNGWDIEVLQTVWQGFGTKLMEVYNYLVSNPDVTEFVFADAFDVVVLGTPEEFEKKRKPKFGDTPIVFSAEKGCWPVPDLSEKYPPTESNFKYLNSGLYYCKVGCFLKIFLDAQPKYEDDDQLYFTTRHLSRIYMEGHGPLPVNIYGSRLDHNQLLFNSHSFIDENEYTYDNGRVQVMGNEPIFIHFNGRTIDEKFNELIKI